MREVSKDDNGYCNTEQSNQKEHLVAAASLSAVFKHARFVVVFFGGGIMQQVQKSIKLDLSIQIAGGGALGTLHDGDACLGLATTLLLMPQELYLRTKK